MVIFVKNLEQATRDLFKQRKRHGRATSDGDMFTQVNEEANELASDQDDESGGVMHTSPRRTELNKHNTNKIVKLCSLVRKKNVVIPRF